MSYSAQISREAPSCLLFLVDQSGSMAEPLGGGSSTKAQELATIINRLLQNAVIRCAQGDTVRDYFDVGVIGYGADVGTRLPDTTDNNPLLPVSQVAVNPRRVEDRIRKQSDGAGGLIEVPVKFPVWFDASAGGATPMTQALTIARTALKEWSARNDRSFPPIVINITDGAATDGDPREVAGEIAEVATTDGTALLFNVHLSVTEGRSIMFPAARDEVEGDYARLLFDMSSVLPGPVAASARAEGYDVLDGSRGFVFNGDATSVITFLDIGTRPALPGAAETYRA